MPDEDTPDEGGLEPAAEHTPTDVAVDDGGEAPEPERYTLEQFAEAYGPRWERFASHEGLEAVRQAGSAYDNATGLIRQGGHLTRQEEDAYRAAGIDPGDVQVPQQDEEQYEAPAPGIWNAPWVQPDEWEAINQLANSDVPEHRQRAAAAIVNAPDAPEQYKELYWDNAYGQGAYKQAVYQQQVAIAQDAKLREELKAELMQELAPVFQDYQKRSSTDLMETVKAQVPGFVEHAAGVVQIWNENCARMPGYSEWFLAAPRPEQLKEMGRLTMIAAAEAAPQRAAAQAQAAEATDAAKIRSRTETARSTSAADPSGDLKRQSIAEAERVFGHVR